MIMTSFYFSIGGNTGAWSIWNLPVCKDKERAEEMITVKRISR